MLGPRHRVQRKPSGADPNDSDTNGDDVSDGTEVVHGTNPLYADSAASLLTVFVAFDYVSVPKTGSFSAPFNTMEEAFGACAAGAAVRVDGTSAVAESPWTGRIELP